jgi:hypothetical protein
MAKSNREKQQDFRERQRERGLVQVCVYVPKDRTEDIKRVAAEMRDE